MVDIDPNLPEYHVRFKRKFDRKNKDDKFEVTRNIAGISDTNNYLDLIKEAEKTAHSEYKNNPNIVKDFQTIVDLNLLDIPEVHIKLTNEQAADLRRNEDILFVTKAKVRRATAESIPWGITRVQADGINTSIIHKGAGVKVVVVDSGIDYTHVDLSPNYKGGATFVPGTTTPQDDFNPEYHGTHVAGTIAAAVNNAGVVGVAAECWLYAAKVLDHTGASLSTTISQGWAWCVANNMQVANNSFSGEGFDQSESDNIHAGYLKNMFWACAVGNDGQNVVKYPSAYANVWGIGAVDQTDTLATFSNWGPVGHVDFVGPGVGIESDMPGNKLQTLSGTSMATPHIAGMAALAFANYRFSPCDTNTFPPAQPKIIHIVGAMIASCDTLNQTTAGKQSADGKYGFGMPQCGTMLSLMSGIH